MKKIFILSKVKNENDIIESFIRYNLSYSDGMMIKDNGSDDNTKEIIQRLIDEGLPIYFTNKGNKNAMAEIAIAQYGADLLIPLDADEFLYHIDGINPRETLEAMSEDIEYQIPWRTYIYEKEPDIKLGFMPNNFIHYRNPELEKAQGHAGTTFITNYLIKEKHAKLAIGSHWLVYPEDHQSSVKIENPEKIVCAHFPIRSKSQILNKTIPSWILKWNVASDFPYHIRENMHQLGILFNSIKKDGDISSETMKKISLEYSICNPKSKINTFDLEKIKKELGNELFIKESLDISFCKKKLSLRHTKFENNYKLFLQATLKEIDSTLMFLTSEADKKNNQIYEYKQLITKNGTLYFETGNNFNENELYCFSFTGNDIEINCQIPDNTIAVRFDPIENYGCIVSNLEILSYNGIVEYELINGFMDNAGNLIFTNTDPQILLKNVAHWLKIKYRILISSDYSHYKVLENYINISNECKSLENERDGLIDVRDGLIDERNKLIIERNDLLNSRSWRITKPLRDISAFIRRHKALYLPVKGLLSLKRNGIKGTINNNKIKKKFNINLSSLIKLTDHEREAQSKKQFSKNIKISIITPLYNTPEKFLKEMIESVRNQTYSNWELCLADGSDKKHNYIKNICIKYSKKDKKIIYKKLDKNEGISENSNRAIEMSSGDYLGLLDHDDILHPSALYEVMNVICDKEPDVIYSDEDHIDSDGNEHFDPFFKPDWSRDLLYSQMYICHFLVVKRAVLIKSGFFNSEFDGSQDYDLMLRISENTELIHHIPKILYSWRNNQTSTSSNPDSKPYANNAGLNALNAHLSRRYKNAYTNQSKNLYVWDTRFKNMQDNPLASIIIPIRDKVDLTEQCIQSIINKSTYSNWEIILLNNNSKEKETYEWFKKIKQKDSRVKIIEANIEFNWSKLNNIGIKNSKGSVFIFLNNDTLVITPDWIERLCENALRDDIGAVGPLLLYEDETIQHAGVVVGMGGWAAHIFKGAKQNHSSSPYVSSVINRNVLAVTGACMCVSKNTIEKIGLFNEDFIICGSDVELCLRAYENGLRNMYNAQVQLYHLESKSRDSFIPEIDFKLSEKYYAPYRKNNDPYFNINLDINSVVPSLKTNKIEAVNESHNKEIISDYSVNINEITPLNVRVDKKIGNRKRLNLIIPSLNIEHVFGGIATALKFFQVLCESKDTDARIIIVDASLNMNNSIKLDSYKIIKMTNDSSEKKQIIDCSDRCNKTIPVGVNDIFIATGWWTAYNIYPVIKWQQKIFNVSNTLIYLIQDYEPGFYQWSSRYLLADSTYKMDISTAAIFNSKLLNEYFKNRNYKFAHEYYFDPVLNNDLKKELLTEVKTIRKKQVIIYGRPSTPRNAFELIILSLKEWVLKQPDIKEWTILSVGEKHPDIKLSDKAVLKSLGKLSLNEYAALLKESYMGISLMVSPHPSYPPLEMSTFGVKTITNCFDNKDLSGFNDNIVSLEVVNEQNIAKNLLNLAAEFPKDVNINLKNDYIESSSASFSEICEKIIDLI